MNPMYPTINSCKNVVEDFVKNNNITDLSTANFMQLMQVAALMNIDDSLKDISEQLAELNRQRRQNNG